MSSADDHDNLVANPATRQVHQRLRRVVLGIYAVTVVAAAALIVGLLWVNRMSSHELAKHDFLRRTEARSSEIATKIATMARELQRLSLRDEMNLSDADSAPEERLLSLSHERSAFFPAGIAIIGATGVLATSEPDEFLHNVDIVNSTWFTRAQKDLGIHIVETNGPGSVMGIVLPLSRDGKFAGLILGAVDLDQDLALSAGRRDDSARVVLLSAAGEILHPASPPAYVNDQAWKQLAVQSQTLTETVLTVSLSAAPHLVATSAVRGTTLRLISIENPDALFGDANRRFSARLMASMLLLLVPGVLLAWVMRRSVAHFTGAQMIAANDDRLRSLGEASSLIAHEIKNSLNGLQMGIDVVLNQAAPEVRAKPSTRALKDELHRLSSFTTRLLSFSRGVVVRATPGELGELLRGVMEVHTDAIAEAGIALKTKIDVTAPVHADAALLHSVVANLLSNARDVLEAQIAPPPCIEVELQRRGDRVTITVADNGPGVAPEFVERMFQPFSTTKPSGVGIGLAVSKAIAVAHGGSLVYRPNQRSATAPRGAEFIFELPVQGDEQVEPPNSFESDLPPDPKIARNAVPPVDSKDPL